MCDVGLCFGLGVCYVGVFEGCLLGWVCCV